MGIIDVHSHLGDILYPNGGKLIEKQGVPMPSAFDLVAYNESMLHRSFGIGDKLYNLLYKWATKAERNRNFAATLENMSHSIDEVGIDYTVCLPIAPYVTYADLAKAREKDPRILPFTSIDFALGEGAAKQVMQDVAEGACGLKLHPIIQRKRLDDPLLLQVLQEYSSVKKPVLTHAGVSHYYLGEEDQLNHPDNGKINYVELLVRTFPNIDFIVGHAGLFQVDEVMTRLKGLDNVWVDTSFQSPEVIQKLIKTFGADKVMYASDWPYGYRKPALKAVTVACKGDKALEQMLFYENAARLLKL
jgi:predicted TIM-barrel fold metal-dependent hydrolase